MRERRRMMYSVSKMPVRMVRMMEVGLGTPNTTPWKIYSLMEIPAIIESGLPLLHYLRGVRELRFFALRAQRLGNALLLTAAL